jgi:CRISPR-associated protein Cas1
MGTLYLDRKDLAMSCSAGRLRLKAGDGAAQDVPLALIERVVVSATVRTDSSALGALAQHGIGVLLLGPRSGERMAIVHGRPHQDARVRLGQMRLADDAAFALLTARRLVAHKLRRQCRLLMQARRQRAEQSRALSKAIATLQTLLPSVPVAADLPTLRGVEGAGAAAHFQALAAVLPPALGFVARRRRPPPDPVNAALSLGYTLLHFEAVRAAYAAGLDPYIGFLHGIAFGRESLASDLIEPLRPALDGWLWRLFADRALRGDHFRTEAGRCYLGKAGRHAFFVAYETFARPQRRALRRLCRHLAATARSACPPAITETDHGTAQDALP